MVYLIFSDIHSNLESLNAFEGVLTGVPHEKKVCLGDIVGYGADPDPVTGWVRENADIILGGNHDYAVTGKTDPSYFNSLAYRACLWTRSSISDENRRFLSALPARKDEDGVCWAHSSPREPESWHYIQSVSDGMENFHHFDAPLCFVGHTHCPMILEQNPVGQVEVHHTPFHELKPGHRYIINVGSIGQPRDRNPDPAFGIYDSEARTFTLQRYSYDYSAAARKILSRGLPPPLAERLSYGL